MKKARLLAAFLAVAFALVFATTSYAQINLNVQGVGSSGVFTSTALSAVSGDPIRGGSPLCGNRIWTSGSGAGIDARATLSTPNLPNEGGNVWVAWDNDTAPTIICSYLSVDSLVGQRLFFGVNTTSADNGTLLLPTNACSTAGANKVSFIFDTATTGLPLAVYNALMGTTSTTCPAAAGTHATAVHFTTAFTDVRAEDGALLQNNRVICADNNTTPFFTGLAPPSSDDKGCLGYPAQSVANKAGFAVKSSFSGSSSTPIAYNITGTDPFSGTAINSFTEANVGLLPMMFFVNTTNSSSGSGGFGDLIANQGLHNTLSHTIAGAYSKQIFLTKDILGGSVSLPTVGAWFLVREPNSGTYTTTEFQVLRQRDGAPVYSQETGINGWSQTGFRTPGGTNNCTGTYPAADLATLRNGTFSACDDPVNWFLGSFPGVASRVIGTGQMLTIANGGFADRDAFGYAFWSLGTFGNKLNVQYLTVDGSDPLFPSWTTHNGVFPGGVAGQGTLALIPAPSPGQCGGYFNGTDTGNFITSFHCNSYALPTFDGIQAGNYRVWNINRAVYYGAQQTPAFGASLNVAGFILSAQNQANPTNGPLPDFVPYSYCGDAACTASLIKHPINVFRSHYGLPGFAPDNGIIAAYANNPLTEKGGDVGGAIFHVTPEIDGNNLSSITFVSWIQ